jgi:hypothetical protein
MKFWELGKVLRNSGKLVVCVNRWRTLDILTSSEKDLQIALAHFLDLCAPNLNRISISCIYDGHDRESPDKALTTIDNNIHGRDIRFKNP